MSQKIGNEFGNLLKELNSTIRSAKEFTTKNAAPTVKDILENAARREIMGIALATVMLGVCIGITVTFYILSLNEKSLPGDVTPLQFVSCLSSIATFVMLLTWIWNCFHKTANLLQIKKNPKSWLLDYVRKSMSGSSDSED